MTAVGLGRTWPVLILAGYPSLDQLFAQAHDRDFAPLARAATSSLDTSVGPPDIWLNHLETAEHLTIYRNCGTLS